MRWIPRQTWRLMKRVGSPRPVRINPIVPKPESVHTTPSPPNNCVRANGHPSGYLTSLQFSGWTEAQVSPVDRFLPGSAHLLPLLYLAAAVYNCVSYRRKWRRLYRASAGLNRSEDEIITIIGAVVGVIRIFEISSKWILMPKFTYRFETMVEFQT